MKDFSLIHFVEWKKVKDIDFIPTLKLLKEWGVKELVAHPIWGFKDLEEPNYMQNIKQHLKSFDFSTPACHAYWGAEHDICFCSDSENTKRIVAEHSLFLDKLSEMDVKTYTMHIGMKDNRQTPWDNIAKALESLLPVAEKNHIILALENAHENLITQQELTDFISKYNNPYLGICFDTGHAHCYGDKDCLKSLQTLSKHIVTCHLHDNYGSFDDHNLPGDGSLDWENVIKNIKLLPKLVHAETESGFWEDESYSKFQKVWNN